MTKTGKASTILHPCGGIARRRPDVAGPTVRRACGNRGLRRGIAAAAVPTAVGPQPDRQRDRGVPQGLYHVLWPPVPLQCQLAHRHGAPDRGLAPQREVCAIREGYVDRHPVRTRHENAMPRLFGHTQVDGMPAHSEDAEGGACAT